ncbi:LysR family transcriptional regulator [Metabacillus fastidiosus]|uniref:LysR family transcriptional regulator n=1 Tax=Metabacillus fastidiosus TaxID=1458 RepID=UPI002E1FB78A|nr:LysR family transcriptional regulator [Metabacillus fastidiosus]
MNIEQFEYVSAIARTGSISIATEQLHVTQAGISKSLLNLEKELGIKLFNRSRLGCSPTRQGEIVIEKINDILAKIEEIKEESQRETSLLQGEVRFSVGPNFMEILSKSIVSFKKDYPNVRLEISAKNSEDIIQDLKEDRTDLGLIYLDNHEEKQIKDLEMKTIVESRMIVCVGKRSSLASKKVLTPQDVISHPFVNIDGNYSNWYMQNFITKHGPLNIIFTSNNIELLKRTIAEGNAVGFFIEFSMIRDPFILNGDLIAIPFVNHEPKTISLGWARKRNKHFSRAQKEFLNYLMKEYEKFSKDFLTGSVGRASR